MDDDSILFFRSDWMIVDEELVEIKRSEDDVDFEDLIWYIFEFDVIVIWIFICEMVM